MTNQQRNAVRNSWIFLASKDGKIHSIAKEFPGDENGEQAQQFCEALEAAGYHTISFLGQIGEFVELASSEGVDVAIKKIVGPNCCAFHRAGGKLSLSCGDDAPGALDRARLEYLERPEYVNPVNGAAGLYMLVLSRGGFSSSRALLAFVRDDVIAAGYNPDGRATSGCPSAHGIDSYTYAMWFHEKRKPSLLSPEAAAAIREAAKQQLPDVDNSDYMESHGREPRGRGRWAFATSMRPEPKEICFFDGSYRIARFNAQKFFRGYDMIYVLG